MTELLDMRGVPIAPGDTALYAVWDGRVEMAEAVVLGTDSEDVDGVTPGRWVSLTVKGRVRLRLIRRFPGGGEKRLVDVAPDRLIVLKPANYPDNGYADAYTDIVLPPSPLPSLED